MKTPRHLVLAVFAILFTHPSPSLAQFSANYQTNIIDGVLSNWVGSGYYVGSNTVFDHLQVINGGVLSNDQGYIGYEASASNNAVLVSGNDSVWSNSYRLVVGSSGPGNQLIITNSGRVVNGDGYIGHMTSGGSNSVLVTGSGSAWSIGGDLYVGYGGTANQLSIINSGRVENNGYAYLGHQTASASNTVLVTGNGSLWSNRFDLYVGNLGGGNRLTVADGGRVENATAYIGNAASSRGNTALVTGIGSVWNNRYDLYVGSDGGGNRLTVADGGRVENATAYIGNAPTSSSNSVAVTGIGSVWNNSGNLHVGYYGAGNQLTITNGGRVESGDGYIGYNSSNNGVLVTGSGSVWDNSGNLEVGNYGVGNQMTIADGGRVVNGYGYLGYHDGTSNSVFISGSGSIWSNRNDLHIGSSAGDNQLIIANGGRVVDDDGYLGWNVSSRNNMALVTGIGSVWNSSGNLHVGYYGAGNQLTIANGGRVEDTDGYIGSNISSSNNTVLVSGGAAWNNSGNLYVGYGASGNELTITSGGQVVSDNGYVGFGPGANNSAVTVSGTDSAWINNGSLYVGYDPASGNRLTITNGGAMIVGGNTYVGYAASSTGNQITVAGGSLTITNVNANGPGTLDVRRGTLAFSGGTITVDGLVANSGASGVVEFNGGILNTRATTVANGSAFVVGNGTNSATLNLLYGQHSFADGLTISSNATLSGNGVINAALTLADGATLAPGNSAGTLYVTSLTLSSGSVLALELASPDGTSDFVNVIEALTLDGTVNVIALPGFTSGTYTLMTYGGALTDFGLAVGLMPEGYSGSIVAGSGKVDLIVIPEPSCLWAALIVGLALWTAKRHFLR